MRVCRVLWMVAGLALPALDRSAADELLLANARIVDPAARTVSEGALLVRDGRIAQVLAEAPGDFDGELLDLGGKWLIPGLVDMHTHSYGDMTPSAAPPGFTQHRVGTEVVARRMLYAGVTAFLDLFGAEDDLFRLRDRQRNGGLVGADIFGAGPCFTATDGHCSEYGVPTRIIDSPEDARRELADLAPRRPDVVKLVYDHEPGRRPTVTRETMAALLREARERRLPSVVHIGTWEDAAQAVEAGARCITHLGPGEIPDALVERMRQEGVAISPTLAVASDLLHLTEDPRLLDDPLLRAVADEEALRAYRDPERLADWVKGMRHGQQASRQSRELSVRKLAAGGVTLLAGTDSGNIGTFQAFSLHRELELLVGAGLSPWQALAAASVDAGRLLGRSWGVQPGDEANLVVLDASPLDDIRNTRAIAAVIHHGAVVDRAALLGQPGAE